MERILSLFAPLLVLSLATGVRAQDAETSDPGSFESSSEGSGDDSDSGYSYGVEEAVDSEGLPVARSQRELVLPEGTVRLDLAYTFGDWGPDGFLAHDLGGGVGLIENFEAGISLNREWFWPRWGGGVLPLYWDGNGVDFHGLPFYARYQFLSTEHLAMAGDLEIFLATYPTPRRHAFRASLPVRIRFDSFMVDTGMTLELQTNDAQGNLYIPALFTFNVSDPLHFRVSTGMGILDFDGDGVFMPLFFGGGYVVRVWKTMIDINAEFGFPQLIHSGDFYGPGTNDHGSPDIWAIKLSTAVYLDLF